MDCVWPVQSTNELCMGKDISDTGCILALGYMIGVYLSDPRKHSAYLLNIPKLTENVEAVKYLKNFLTLYPDAPFYEAIYDKKRNKEEE